MWIREYFQHHQDLEVRVAYGAPPQKQDNAEQYVPYLEKQLPQQIQIAVVRCGNHYSALLAKSLGVPASPHKQLVNSSTMDEAIRKNPANF